MKGYGGKVVSAAYFDRPEFEAHDYLTPRAGPVVEADQTLIEIDVPKEYKRLPLSDFIERLQDDNRSKFEKVKSKQ